MERSTNKITQQWNSLCNFYHDQSTNVQRKIERKEEEKGNLQPSIKMKPFSLKINMQKKLLKKIFH